MYFAERFPHTYYIVLSVTGPVIAIFFFLKVLMSGVN